MRGVRASGRIVPRMARTIVVGYDGSDHGDDALALARLLAEVADAELVVVCAYPEDPLGESATGREIADGVRAEAERTLERARARLGAGADGRVDLRAIAGSSPSRVLHAAAEDLSAAAIVVGSSHHGKALRLLTGSTPEAVLDHAPCPVAVAPDGFRDAVHASGSGAGGLRQVAVAFDGSPEAAHAVEVAADWARLAGARLRIVTAIGGAAVGVYPPPLDAAAYEQLSRLARDEARRRLDDTIAALGGGLAAEGAVLDGEPVATLVAESARDDLLFVGSGGKGPLRRVLLGSVSSHLLREAACPVAVVPRGSGAAA
jgi:nucleotide-binding universal stress UspA family protein